MGELDFYPVCNVEELPVGSRLYITLDDIPIVLFNIASDIYAILDECTHDDGPLGDGELDGHQIICPRHGARFDIKTGKVLSLPAIKDVLSFPVRIQGGKIEIGLMRD